MESNRIKDIEQVTFPKFVKRGRARYISVLSYDEKRQLYSCQSLPKAIKFMPPEEYLIDMLEPGFLYVVGATSHMWMFLFVEDDKLWTINKQKLYHQCLKYDHGKHYLNAFRPFEERKMSLVDAVKFLLV